MAVGVEDIHILQTHALEALVEAAEQVLPAAPLSIGAIPHVVASLGGDDQLVAVGGKVLGEILAKVQFSRPRGGTVVVGQVEVGDPQIEGGVQHLARRRKRIAIAKVVPEAQRESGQLQAALATAVVGHSVISIVMRCIHPCTLLHSSIRAMGPFRHRGREWIGAIATKSPSAPHGGGTNRIS